jgi:DNA-binding XRE family transcriptional regulator
MSEDRFTKYPYRSLGFRLRNLREKFKETIDEVSGAVEIDKDQLVIIESGLKLPEEDILLLLISHFNLKDEEAKSIWQLAGYENYFDNLYIDPPENNIQQPTIVIVPIDNKVIYSDLLQISANNYGLVLNFMQAGNPKNNLPQFVSRIGISREHARDIVAMLSEAINASNIITSKKLDSKPSKNKSNTDEKSV